MIWKDCTLGDVVTLKRDLAKPLGIAIWATRPIDSMPTIEEIEATLRRCVPFER